MKKHAPSVLSALALAAALPSAASAQSQVFLNGIDISGTKNQTFENVNIFFDAIGNISITAPQYKVLEQPAQGSVAPSAAPPAQAVDPLKPQSQQPQPNPDQTIPTLPDPEKPTYLLALFNAPGLLGYNVEVSINGVAVKTLTQGTAAQSFEISQHLRRNARNTLQYRLIMAADSGSSSRATVHISLAKADSAVGNSVELLGEYAPVEIKGIDGAKTYEVQIDVQ